jgi:hypothetical protein
MSKNVEGFAIVTRGQLVEKTRPSLGVYKNLKHEKLAGTR